LFSFRAEPLFGGKDFVGGLGPFEGFWLVVVVIDEIADVGFELGG
jgi:hypothetical protein